MTQTTRTASMSAAYAQKACDCRPGFVCRFCRNMLTPKRRARPKRETRPIPRTPGYRAAHARVVAVRGRASAYRCVGDCGRPAADWAYDNADPEELVTTVNGAPRRYSLHPARYQPMCRRCHKRFDHHHRALRVYASW